MVGDHVREVSSPDSCRKIFEFLVRRLRMVAGRQSQTICEIIFYEFVASRLEGLSFTTDQAPVSQMSRNFSGILQVPQFPLYLRNAEVVSHQSSQSSWFFLH